MSWAEGLLLLGAFVHVPLAMRLIGVPRPVLLATPVAALCLAASLFTSVWLALPWLAVALAGAWPPRFRSIEDLALTAARAYLVVGAGWAVLSRLGIRPMNFPSIIVLLTAVHFTYTGFIAVVLAVHAHRRSHVGVVPVVGFVAGMPLVGAGITLWRPLEVVAACMLAGAGLVLAYLHLREPSILLRLSGASFAVSMLLAIGYAAGVPWIDIQIMLPAHGLLNAVGFALPALVFRFWSLSRSSLTIPAHGEDSR
jgi:YndJ-like protein